MADHSEEEYYQRADNLLQSCCKILQSIFKRRWTSLTGNEWQPDSSTEFIKSHKHIFLRLQPIQKKLLEKGIVEEWDITLLSMIIQNLSGSQSTKMEGVQINKLRKLRNGLAHKNPKKQSYPEYQEIEAEIKNCLRFLSVEEAEIEKIVELAEITSFTLALEKSQKLKEEGDVQVGKKAFEKAIGIYSEGISLPSLPPANLSILFEKRGKANYLWGKGNEEMRSAHYDLALKDAEKALEINASSWKAQHIIGLVLKERFELEKALQHFRNAVSIAPGDVELITDFKSCKLLAGVVEREEHLDPSKLPMTLPERVEHFTNESGIHMTEEAFLNISKKGGNIIPGSEHTFRGHQFQCGWGVQQSFTDAAGHYAKAMKLGNAEGTYNLALLYKNGKGVTQDLDYAIKLLEKATAMPMEIKVKLFKVKNVGVLEAHHSLGLLYEEGIGIQKDCKKAAAYYKKAADRKFGNSAHNLGLLHERGEGVEKDDKLAEHYLKVAVEAKNMNAAVALSHFYLEQMEPHLARKYFEMSITLGNDRLESIRNEYFEQIKEVEEARRVSEGKVVKFENEKGLSSKGITFKERVNRMVSMHSPEAARFVEDHKQVEASMTNAHTSWAGKMQTGEVFIMDEINARVEEGLLFAKEMGICFSTKLYIIGRWEEKGVPKSEDEIMEVLGMMYVCLSSPANFLFGVTSEIRQEFVQWLKKILEKYGNEEGCIDKCVRLCYCYMNISRGIDPSTVKILEEGLRRYPDEVAYHRQHASLYGLLHDNKKGLEVAEKGLIRFPDDYELLYDKAVHRRLTMNDLSESPEVREAYKNFAEKAPKDHRKLPEAYYCIAQTFLTLETGCGVDGEGYAMIKKYYELGMEAEKNLLSCFLPYDSTPKILLEMIVSKKGVSYPARLPVPPTPSTSGITHATSKKAAEAKSSYKISGKSYLENEERIQTILKYRQRIMLHYEHLKMGGTPTSNLIPPSLKQYLIHY